MTDREFKVQVMETAAQWKSGLLSRLELGVDGLSLFLNPAFDSWLVSESDSGAGDIVVDECGQTYWTSLMPQTGSRVERVWRLLRHNPTTNQVEHVLTFAGCGLIEPRELWLTPDYLWIFDHGEADSDGLFKGRMLALARDTYQIIQEFVVEQLIDVDFDSNGSCFYALVRECGQTQLCRYSTTQENCYRRECCTITSAKNATAIAVGKDGYVYVLDSGDGRLIRFNPTKKQIPSGIQHDILKDFQATAMQIDKRGVIFLARSNPAQLYMFDADGSYLGELELPSRALRAGSATQMSVDEIRGIGFDGSGGVYLATNLGLAKFTLTKNPIGQEGVFYSMTLDNGQTESLWHRIALRGRLPSKSSIDVYYYTSDNEALKIAHDNALNDAGKSVEEKATRIERLFSGRWDRPIETFTATEAPTARLADSHPEVIERAYPDLIINPNKGRFLWFKLGLRTFDQRSRPSICSARIYYPRLSYLRYLPPAYREEPVSAGFLERFLSIFETGFEGLDKKIDQLFRYFDPSLAPKAFLPWLASWINLSLDEDLPEARVRRLIQRAPYIYSRKGTAGALVEFLEIYTGKSVYLTEYSRDLKPMVIGQADWSLGTGLVLLAKGPQGMTVGDTTVVGYSAVRDRVSDPDEPFFSLARRFAVVLDMDRDEFEKRKSTLQRIVREQSPAHTTFTMRITGDQRTVGKAVLGVSAVVHEPQHYRVGLTQLGGGSAIAKGPQAVRLERGAWIGSSGRL